MEFEALTPPPRERQATGTEEQGEKAQKVDIGFIKALLDNAPNDVQSKFWKANEKVIATRGRFVDCPFCDSQVALPHKERPNQYLCVGCFREFRGPRPGTVSPL